MGRYSTDPADLAAFNAGLPPDEWAAVVYIPSPAEIEAEERLARVNWRPPPPRDRHT